MYHLRLKGDYYQMGVKRGNIFQKAHISFPLQLDNFQLEHGKQSEEILRKLAEDKSEYIRESVAANANSSEDILRKLLLLQLRNQMLQNQL